MHLREFFYFQKSDRMVIIVALCVAVVALVVVYLVGEGNEVTTTAGTTADSTTMAGPTTGRQSTAGATGQRQVRLVPFDPNTADSATLLGLGLQPWQVRNIYRYRSRGGIYREPEDFARVYGLTVGQYRELAPYIRISPDYRPAAELFGAKGRRQGGYSSDYRRAGANKGTTWDNAASSRQAGEEHADRHTDRMAPYQPPAHSRDTVRYPVKLKAGEHIDLNAADTALLKRVPGIGSYYARRIVAYRERLGGFFSTDQLFEIEGFPEGAADYLVCRTGVARRLNVNKLSLAQLRQHPYFSFYQAKAIVDYRRLKGPLHSLDELSLLPDFPPEVIARLQHYVEF